MNGKRIMGHGGFTLLETLIAAAILTIVSAMVFEAFAVTLSAGQGVEERARVYHEARFIIRKLTDDLASASLYPNNQTQAIFAAKDLKTHEAATDEISFTGFGRRAMLAESSSDEALITWNVEYDDKTKLYTLYRSENPYVTDLAMAREMGEKLDVTDRIKSFNLRFGDGVNWADGHDSRQSKKLPNTVSLEFSLDDGKGHAVTRRALIPVGGAR
ncbi:MAG: type II secretion system protein [Nitrospinae bacterium]|nr:type II secretion system protein [Nitrospinota bacterium]